MTEHTTVLLHEAVDGLSLHQGDRAIDATLGAGGHARLMAERVGKEGAVFALDADRESLTEASERLASEGVVVETAVGNFRDIDLHAAHAGFSAVQGILFDLGWNAGQLAAGRGFSFNADEPLLMTYGASVGDDGLTAHKVVNTWSEDDIAEILHELGEERHAGRIARAIVEARAGKPLERATELRDLIEAAVPGGKRHLRIHPATKTFQALRMVVNGELRAVNEALPKALTLLKPRGRLAVITFHSIEDRVVKRIFKTFGTEGRATLVTKKPVTPSRSEVITNRRARSAKLRIIEKI